MCKAYRAISPIFLIVVFLTLFSSSLLAWGLPSQTPQSSDQSVQKPGSSSSSDTAAKGVKAQSSSTQVEATTKAGVAQRKVTPEELQTELKRFLSWFPGEYNNHEQVWRQEKLEEEVIYTHVHHIFSEIKAPQLGSHIFYVEQRMVKTGHVFRQRIYEISPDQDRGALRLDIYKFTDEQRWRGVHTKPEEAAKLTQADLTPMPGCQVYWTYEVDQEHFKGSMDKDQCRIVSARTRQPMIINDDLILESNAIMIRDVARNMDGKVLFGYPDKPHYRNVKVQYYTGWAVIRPGGPKHDDDEARWDINQNLHLHSEGGKLPLLGPDDQPTGYTIQLARVTRPSSKTEVLKLSVIDDATEENVAYTWTTPGSKRIGINLLWARIGLTQESQTPQFGFDPAPPPRKTKRSDPPPQPQVIQVKRPTLVVSDIDASLKVYRDLLGFSVFYLKGKSAKAKKKGQDDQSEQEDKSSKAYDYFSIDKKAYTYTRFATLNTPSQERAFGLMEVVGGPLKQAQPRLSTIVLQVRDLDELRPKLIAAGLKVFESDEGSTPEGKVFREMPFADPDGHIIVLYDLKDAPASSAKPAQ